MSRVLVELVAGADPVVAVGAAGGAWASRRPRTRRTGEKLSLPHLREVLGDVDVVRGQGGQSTRAKQILCLSMHELCDAQRPDKLGHRANRSRVPAGTGGAARTPEDKSIAVIDLVLDRRESAYFEAPWRVTAKKTAKPADDRGRWRMTADCRPQRSNLSGH